MFFKPIEHSDVQNRKTTKVRHTAQNMTDTEQPTTLKRKTNDQDKTSDQSNQR
jgi:hypothetical protein